MFLVKTCLELREHTLCLRTRRSCLSVRSRRRAREAVEPLSCNLSNSRRQQWSNVLFAILLTVSLVSADRLSFAAQRTRPKKGAATLRSQPPKPGPVRPLKLPTPREVKLPNGLTLVLIEDHRAPIVTALVGIPLVINQSAGIAEMTNQLALAEATAELITEGAGSRTSEQLAREDETLGGRIASSANSDYAEVTVSVLAENVERMMKTLGDVIVRPNFPEDEVALFKKTRIDKLVVQRQDPAFLVDEQFDRAVFGSHYYAISSPTPASVEALDRTRIRQFYESSFTPTGSVAVIAGDFTSSEMERIARANLGDWKGREKTLASAKSVAIPSARRQVLLIDRPGSEQADFRVGGLAIKRSDPDFFPLLVTNAVLGAGTSSRLFMNIREKKGYAYDASSSLNALLQAGTFYGGAQTRTEVTAAAIKEMLLEFDRLRTVVVPPKELQAAKNYLNGLFSIVLSTQGGAVERVAQTHLFGLGQNYLEAYRGRVEGVTAAQVQQMARKYLISNRAMIVVVGDASKLAKDLRAIGSIQILNSDGETVKQTAGPSEEKSRQVEEVIRTAISGGGDRIRTCKGFWPGGFQDRFLTVRIPLLNFRARV